MRGAVCYVFREYSCGGDLSENCDVRSFWVLLLVVIAGRRPLQVDGSPMSEFQRMNLLLWAHHLTRAWKLIDLPSMKEIVAMLYGDLELPPLPVEYSPSPPSRFRSHRKARAKAMKARMVEAHGGAPAATSRLSPLPPERADYDRGATIDIPLDTADGDNQQSGGDYSEDEEGDNEEVQNESEESEESD
ncbi:hypothetical protein Tco_1248523 [Tanacetum coccineum]